MQGARCNLPFATCNLPLATCNLPLATCNLPFATCHLQPATCHLQPATCHLQPATCHLQPATCNLQPATRYKVTMCWAKALVKIARMILTIKLDGNWNSFQLANNTPPLSVTGSVIAPSARMLLIALARCQPRGTDGTHVCCAPRNVGCASAS